MSWLNSLAMAVPATRREICNRLMAACFRGPDTFKVAIRDKVTLAIVGYAAHTYDDELIDFFLNGTVPAGVTLARLQQFGFATAAEARTAASYIRYRYLDSRDARANLKARLDQEGWELAPPEGAA